jgi:aryl-alcohol dehydrogenase-like predicted oxidoreductase
MRIVDPIGSGPEYATDVARARLLWPVVAAGHAASLPEMAIRYAIANASLSTTEIGIATLGELQQAADAINKGPLPSEALAQISGICARFAGEP